MKTIAHIVLLAVVGPAFAAEQRAATVWWRGVDEFEKAQTDNAMDATVRRPGIAGEVGMPAIFLHPLGTGRTVANFPAQSLGFAEGLQVFFLTHVGIADGFEWGQEERPADGARFYVTFEGEDVLTAEVKESAWLPLAASVYEAPEGGGVFSGAVSLATDAGEAGNVNYDWAMFGEPMLVSTDGKTLRQATPVGGASGVVIVDVAGGQGEIIVEGLARDGQAVPEAESRLEIDGPGMTFVRFDFGSAEDCTQWQWRAEGCRVTDAWGGSWEPWLKLEHFGPTQAVTVAGDALTMRASVTNKGIGTLVPAHDAYVEYDGQRKPVERLAPGETAEVEFDLGIPDVGTQTIEGMAFCGTATTLVTTQVDVWPELPRLPGGRPRSARAKQIDDDYLLVENPHCRWLIHTGGEAQGALVYAWAGDAWRSVGSVTPWLARMITSQGGHGLPSFGEFMIEDAADGVQLRAESAGRRFSYTLDAHLPDDGPAMRVSLTVRPEQDTDLAAVWGPAVHVGDRSTGTNKGIAIFPGLEYLDGEERSSSTRDLAPPLNERWTPHRFKVTVPMMLVETRSGGPVMGVAWDPNQKWDGEHSQPAVRFASPDFLEHTDSHLMQLGLPSVPEFIPEGQRTATDPIPLEAGDTWELEQYIIVGVPEPDATAALEWFDELIGYPEAEEAPRDFEEEMALCRHGFLESAWDAETEKSRHVVGWAAANAPGFAALMLMDGRAVAEGDEKTRVLDRVALIGENTLRDGGAAGLASSAGCHIMGWEFPYHWGHLPGALAGMKSAAYGALRNQEADGGWGYNPDERRKELGEPGARVVGICGRNAYVMAKWVAVSGDPVIEQALRKALKHMEQYRVPRGAQGWECPILEPDVLASAYAVRAYVWAYMATGEERWLEKARYWARTGLPFQYTWDDGERPGMRYASIPVFGSTHFRHSWIGLPVQWCGLVYAYGLQELMRFDDNDLWRRQVEGITVSAMHQQWPLDLDPDLVGTYPDSYGAWFTRRNPVHINPEDIAINVLALNGLDPGLRSVPVKVKGGPVHVTAPGDIRASLDGGELTVRVKCLPNEVVYATVAPVAPGDAPMIAGGEALERRENLEPGQTGWAHDPDTRVLVIGVRADGDGGAQVILSEVRRSLPETPKPRQSWEFKRGAEGWGAANACSINAEGGQLKLTVTGEDPYAMSGPAAIDAVSSKLLTARVRLTAGREVGLFWRSTASSAWGPDKEVSVGVPADGEWHEVTWDLSGHPLWAGKIIQLRLDIEPSDAAPGTVLEVDWIRAEPK